MQDLYHQQYVGFGFNVHGAHAAANPKYTLRSYLRACTVELNSDCWGAQG